METILLFEKIKEIAGVKCTENSFEKKDLTFLTFTFEKEVSAVEMYVMRSLFALIENGLKKREGFYSYSFFVNFTHFFNFINTGGMVTVGVYQNDLVIVNMSCLRRGEYGVVLSAGISVSMPHHLGLPVFEYNNYNYVLHAVRHSIDLNCPLFVTTLINDGLSLENFNLVTSQTAYPFYENSLSREDLKIYKTIAQESFNDYTAKYIPNSLIDLNTMIVKSDKKLIGFEDSFQKIKHGSSIKYSFFIKTWVSNFAEEDILFVGRIRRDIVNEIEVAFDQLEAA